MSNGAAVADVDEVIELGTASYAGFADAGPIDAGIGLELGIALDHDVARLDDLVPVSGVCFVVIAVTMLGEAEAVAAYDDSVLEQDVVSQSAELSNHSVGVSEEVVADADSAIDDDVGQENGVVSDDDIFVDHHVGADVRVLAQLGLGVNDRSRMNSGSIARCLIEEFDGLRPG